MPLFICTTCGTQFAEFNAPPEQCTICTDERQFVGWNGQQWTTLEALRQSHQTTVRLEELGLYGVGMEPSFAIGQRALLVTRPSGNVLWDCIPLVDEALVEMIKIHDDVTLIRCGEHFDGGTVLHWSGGADGKGALLSGDIIQVVEDRRWVSFMYSYPNLIPLSAPTVRRLVAAVGVCLNTCGLTSGTSLNFPAMLTMSHAISQLATGPRAMHHLIQNLGKILLKDSGMTCRQCSI